MRIDELKKEIGKEFYDITDDSFRDIMEKHDKETLLAVRGDLKQDDLFYKRINAEEYKKKNPNGFRYQHADKQLAKIKAKGMILKSIIEKKE